MIPLVQTQSVENLISAIPTCTTLHPTQTLATCLLSCFSGEALPVSLQSCSLDGYPRMLLLIPLTISYYPV